MDRARRAAEREIGDDQAAVLQDAVGERGVRRGVDDIRPGAQHGDRARGLGPGLERAAVRGAVDAQGEPADDAQPALREAFGESTRVVLTIGRRVARSDDRDGILAQPSEQAAREEQRRMPGGLTQRGRVIRMGRVQQGMTGKHRPGEGRVDAPRDGVRGRCRDL